MSKCWPGVREGQKGVCMLNPAIAAGGLLSDGHISKVGHSRIYDQRRNIYICAYNIFASIASIVNHSQAMSSIQTASMKMPSSQRKSNGHSKIGRKQRKRANDRMLFARAAAAQAASLNGNNSTSGNNQSDNHNHPPLFTWCPRRPMSRSPL